MARVAIISDIHGNVPALEATLRDIRRRAIARIICLGDLVGKGPHSDWDDTMAGGDLKSSTREWHRARLGSA